MPFDKGSTGNNKLSANSSVGRPNFIARTGLDSPERAEMLNSVLSQIDQHNLDVVRFAFVDIQGLLRIRPIEARHFAQACRNGAPFTVALLAMDSSNDIFKPVFSGDGGFGRAEMGGAGDMLAVPDLSTFRILPWAERTGWILGDLYLSSGERCPFDPRFMMQKACSALDKLGFSFIGGVEVECHVLRVEDPHLSLTDCTQPARAASVSALRHGYQYMSELVVDELQPIIRPIREALVGVGLPLRTLEAEWGPGQLEITLDPMEGVAAADAMILLRSTVKQVARRLGMIASFMTKPGLPNVYSSGWHLHQSLGTKAGQNAFASEEALLSPVGLHYIGGILKHVRAGTAFSNPTINGYKRLNANPLAPKRAVWSGDNKGAMCRVIGAAGDISSHLENRSGEPAANPYLYMASQIFAGIDGINNEVDPGPPLDDPYGQMGKPLLPKNLNDAIEALAESSLYRETFGSDFVDHFIAMKTHEIGRFQAYVTDWEHREYFEAF